MSISSLITEASFAVEFPRLMNSIVRPGLVLLFSEPGVATVVAVPHAEEIYTVGYHSADWQDSYFEIFNGELNLCNEADVFVDNEPDDGEGHVLGGLAQKEAQDPTDKPCCGICQFEDKTQAPDGEFVRAISLDQLLAILKQGGEVKHA